jgi:hypothetical protein
MRRRDCCVQQVGARRRVICRPRSRGRPIKKVVPRFQAERTFAWFQKKYRRLVARWERLAACFDLHTGVAKAPLCNTRNWHTRWAAPMGVIPSPLSFPVTVSWDRTAACMVMPAVCPSSSVCSNMKAPGSRSRPEAVPRLNSPWTQAPGCVILCLNGRHKPTCALLRTKPGEFNHA